MASAFNRWVLAAAATGLALAAAAAAKERLADSEKSKRSKLPTVALAASAATVLIGDSVTLNWSSTNSKTCSASGGWSGAQPLAGSVVLSNVVGTQSYTLTCSGKKGSATQTVTVEATPPPPPQISLSSTAAQIVRGTSVTLDWNARGATGCTASGDWAGARPVQGQETIVLAKDSVFSLSCTGRGGSNSVETIVTVVPPPLFVLGTPSTRTVTGASPVNPRNWGMQLMQDLDGDNRDDLVITGAHYPFNGPDWSPKAGYVAFNSATGFRAATADQFPVQALQSVHVREFAVVDFNEDGVKDLFVADHGYDAGVYPGFRNQLFLSQGGKPSWIDATANLPGVADFSHSVTTGDVNADGNVDILVGNWDVNDPAYLLMGDGRGGFTKDTTRLPDLRHFQLAASHLADLDGDKLPEFVIGTCARQERTQVLWNQNGSLAASQFTKLAEPVNFGNDWCIYDIQDTDLNNDGRQDLVIQYQAHVWNGGWQIQFLVNEGNRSFSDQTAKYLPYPEVASSAVPTEANPISWIEFLWPRDLNDDGLMDFWVVAKAQGGLIVDNCPIALIRQPDSTFKPVTAGMLRKAGVPDYFFWGVWYAANGPGPGGELVNVFLSPEDRVTMNIMPITFTK